MPKNNTTYKQTEVGLIPSDWEVKKLGDYSFITKLAGFEYTLHFNSYKDEGDIIVVRGTNITHNKLDLNDVRTIPRTTSNYLQRSKLFKNDLVFAYVGTIGPIFLVEEDDRFHLGPNTAKITVNKELNSMFLFHYFTSSFLKKEIIEHTSVGAQPSLSMSKIRSFKIIVPPTLAEQIAIATALSDADAYIGALEKLIAKKRMIKQGAMHELLQPKEGWEVRKLGEICEIYTGNKNNQDKVENGLYPFFVRSQAIESINSYSFDGEAILIPGEGNIGKIFHYINGKFDYHQRVYKISDFNEGYSGKYIYRYMSEYFGRHAMENSVKATVDSLRLPTFQIFTIPFPKTIQEQTRIANILSDMDAEIAALEKQLTKARCIKQGMMQNLLTGKVRLI